MKRFHRAWAMCLGCTLMLLVCGGLCINVFSVTQPYILSQNGFTNTQTSMITTIRSVVYLVFISLAPLFFRKTGYRWGLTLAVLLAAVSFAVFALAKSLAAYYLAGAIAGACHGLGSMIPTTILMTRWFRSRRGMAIGICAAGTGVSAVVFSPILSRIIEQHSLRACFFFEGGLSVLTAALVFLLVRESPESCGIAPFGMRQETAQKAQSTSDIRPTRLRWMLLYGSVVLLGAIAGPGFAHMMILFTSSGFSGTQAAFAVSIFGLALMLGKFFYGAACDKLGSILSNQIFGACLLAGLACCILAEFGGVAVMLAAAILFGVGVPLCTVGLSVWAADFTEPDKLDSAVQRFQLCYAIGALVFSFMPGAFADLTGSYAPAYIVFFLFGAFSLFVVQLTYRQGRKAKTAAH